MASMLIGSAVGAASAARVTAVRPRAGAGARAFAFGANHAASPSRVASLGRRGTVRVAVRASLGAETVCEEKPEARVVPEDAPASASRSEALKQVQHTRFQALPTMAKNIANLARVRAFRSWRADSLTVRHPRLPSFHAVRTSRRARRRCHGPRAGFPLCVPAPAATHPAVFPRAGRFFAFGARTVGENPHAARGFFYLHFSRCFGISPNPRARPRPHHAGASLAAAKAKSAVAVAGPIPFLPFTHNQILRAVNLGSLPAWFSMVLLPRWRHAKTITLAVAVAYSLLYATLACVLFSESVLSLDLKTLTTAEGVTKVFSDSTAVLAGWAHFIVFDLFTARFFLQDSARVGIPHLAVVPCILGCMFFGPVGLLTYVLVKKIYRTIRDKEGGAVKTYSF